VRRIEARWLSYRNAVIQPSAGPVQLLESRRAFYAGAQGLLTEIVQMIDPGQDPTKADLLKMDEIARELQDFANAVGRGEA
jgi:hypothetical protein